MTVRFRPPVSSAQGPLPHPAAPLTLGFLSSHNPFDRRTFSGTAHFAVQALSRRSGLRLKVLGPHRPLGPLDLWRERLLGPRAIEPDPQLIDFAGIDVVVGLVASTLLDKLDPAASPPFVHVTDATPAFLREFYGWEIPPEADAIEGRVARRAAAVCYSSDAIARRATRDLGSGITTRTIPFGINFETLPGTCPVKPPAAPLRLLFVCTDWDRKGGDMVLNILVGLRDREIPTELTVVGRCPKHLRHLPGLRHIRYLDKNRPDECARLSALYAESHLLLLPTRADCTPMVVAEALAHGTPVLARATGGMRSLMAAGCGALMAADAEAEEWIASVVMLGLDQGRFTASSKAAFDHAHSTLTWDTWARQIEVVCRDTLIRRQAA